MCFIKILTLFRIKITDFYRPLNYINILQLSICILHIGCCTFYLCFTCPISGEWMVEFTFNVKEFDSSNGAIRYFTVNKHWWYTRYRCAIRNRKSKSSPFLYDLLILNSKKLVTKKYIFVRAFSLKAFFNVYNT